VDSTRKIKKYFSLSVRGKHFGKFPNENRVTIPNSRVQTRRTRCDFCIGCPRGREYRLLEQYAKAVSDDYIQNVNSYRTLYAFIKRVRDDGSGLDDLVIE